MSEDLLRWYIKRGMGASQIADKLGCSERTIHRKLANLNLKRKSLVEAEELRVLVLEKKMSAKECADYYGLCLGSIYRHLKAQGLKPYRAPNKKTLEIEKLYLKGMRQCDIASRLGVSRQSVYLIVRKLKKSR